MKKTRYDIPELRRQTTGQSRTTKAIKILDTASSTILIVLVIVFLPFAIILWCFLDIAKKNEENDRKWSFFFWMLYRTYVRFFIYANVCSLFCSLFLCWYIPFFAFLPPFQRLFIITCTTILPNIFAPYMVLFYYMPFFTCSRLRHALFVPSLYICTIDVLLTLYTPIFREKSRYFFDISPPQNNHRIIKNCVLFFVCSLNVLNEGHWNIKDRIVLQ